MKKLAGIELLIFDVDGVLRDSSEIINEGYRSEFISEGLRYPYETQDMWHMRCLTSFNGNLACIKALYALELCGNSGMLHETLGDPDAESILNKATNGILTPQQEETAKRIRSRFEIFFDSQKIKGRIPEIPHSKSAIESLKQKGYKVAIFTNAARVTVARDISFLGLFDQVLGIDDVKHGKPSPEGVEMALTLLNVKKSNAAYVGDAASDILTAKNAGCTSIGVLTGMGLRMYLQLQNPDLIVNDLYELDELL